MKLPENAIYNEADQVAMKYKRQAPLRVRCGGHPNYKTYIFTIQANMGVSPWTVFHQGLASVLDLTIGKAIILTGVVLVIINLVIGERIGISTLLNMVFIGLFVDLIFLVNIIPECQHYLSGTIMLIIGMLTIAVASCLYIGAGYGSGPRDGLMISLSGITGWKPGLIRFMIESSVLLS